MEITMITICIPCGYIYDGELAFERLPQDWCCPDCGASINCFDTIDPSLPEKKSKIDYGVMTLEKIEKT